MMMTQMDLEGLDAVGVNMEEDVVVVVRSCVPMLEEMMADLDRVVLPWVDSSSSHSACVYLLAALVLLPAFYYFLWPCLSLLPL